MMNNRKERYEDIPLSLSLHLCPLSRIDEKGKLACLVTSKTEEEEEEREGDREMTKAIFKIKRCPMRAVCGTGARKWGLVNF